MRAKKVVHCSENQQFGFWNKTKFNAQLKIKFRQELPNLQKNFFHQTDKNFNFRTYPVKPNMNDLEIAAFSCCQEALGIDSENLLWSKLKTDYAKDFPNLIDRTRFNRRRRRLQSQIDQIQEYVGSRLAAESSLMIIDSVPVPVVKLARDSSYKICKDNFQTAPAKGYSSVNKGWFIGYKLHVIIFGNGVVQQSGNTKGMFMISTI